MSILTICYAENLCVLQQIPSESIDLIYIDPPFNTGKVQKLTRIHTVQDDEGTRIGFKGNSYKSTEISTNQYNDIFEDYIGFLELRLNEAKRVLKSDGSIFVHLDYHEVHYVKVVLDQIFGRSSFKNEIIWAYDYGARSKTKWATKHDNILWYAKDPNNYHFDQRFCARIPYMAPGLVGEEKSSVGKLPTDTWWNTIVPTNGKERTGYPTQKPRGILDRIVRVHSKPGDLLLDFFAGSGSFGESAILLGRKCILVDNNIEAYQIMQRRFGHIGFATAIDISQSANDIVPDNLLSSEELESRRSKARVRIWAKKLARRKFHDMYSKWKVYSESSEHAPRYDEVFTKGVTDLDDDG